MTLATPDVLQQKALAARYGDLEAYALAVHRMQVEPYQLAWEEALNSSDRTVIVCPPGTFKSSTVQYWIEREIGHNPDLRVLWIMNSGGQSERRVSDIGRTITANQVYKKAFPNVKPDPEGQWTKTSLYVKRSESHPDPTVFGSGWDGPYQGLHCHIIILDDLTNQKEIRSSTTMEEQRSMLRGVILDRLEDNGRIVAIMTRWGEEDLLPTFQDMGFTTIVMPVVADYPWGPTISNKRFPLSRIEELRSDKTDALFDLTYMCNPSALSGGIIKREHINYWDRDSLPETATFSLMTVDPAISTKSWADPSAITIGLMEPKTRTVYVTDVITGRWDAPQLEEQIVKYAKRTARLLAIGVETIGYQASIVQRLVREYKLPVVELPYRSRREMTTQTHGLDRNKEGRAIYLDYKLSRRQILLPNPTTGIRLPLRDGVSVESELCSFPFGKHDDRLDALSFLGALADTYSTSKRLSVSIRS